MNTKKIIFSVIALVVCLFANAQNAVYSEAHDMVISNTEMNVIYRGYSNHLDIAVPGFNGSELTITAEGATFEYQGGCSWICKINAGNTTPEIAINVSATRDGKTQEIGHMSFRICTPPTPQAYIKLANGELWSAAKGSIKTIQLEGATVVCEYGPSVNLLSHFLVESFELAIADGMGGFRKISSNGNKFSDTQMEAIRTMKSGDKIILTNIRYSGPKSGKNLPFEPLVLK